MLSTWFFSLLSVCLLYTITLTKDYLNDNNLKTEIVSSQLNSSTNDQNRYVRIIYMVPADSIEKPEYVFSLENAVRHLQIWFSEQLGNNRSFRLHNPIVEVYKTPHEANWYSTNPSGEPEYLFWYNVLNDAFQLTGGRFDDENNIWIFYIDALNACGQETGATNGVALMPANDLRGFVGKPWIPTCPDEVVPDYSPCRYVGGLGHELGHAFGLPHPPGCEPLTLPECDQNSIMWLGFIDYPDTYFSENEKALLYNSPFISELEISNCRFDCDNLLLSHDFSDTLRFSICEGDSIFIGDNYRTSAGTYYDSLLTVNSCDSIIITELIVNPVYETYVHEEICEGESIMFGGEPLNTSGTYYDTLLSIHGCDSIIIMELIVNTLPLVDLGNDTTISTIDTIILNAGDGHIDYIWSNGSNEQTITLSNLQIGDYDYSVKVTDNHNCDNSDTILIHVILPNSLDRTGTPFQLDIFPNPTSDFLFIQPGVDISSEFIIMLVDNSGQVVFEKRIDRLEANKRISLDLKNLHDGSYLLLINSKKITTINKIIKY